jgi:predicted DNA-binding protein
MKENNVYKGGYTLSTGITKETQGAINMLCEITGRNKSELVREMVTFCMNNTKEFLKALEEGE